MANVGLSFMGSLRGIFLTEAVIVLRVSCSIVLSSVGIGVDSMLFAAIRSAHSDGRVENWLGLVRVIGGGDRAGVFLGGRPVRPIDVA